MKNLQWCWPLIKKKYCLFINTSKINIQKKSINESKFSNLCELLKYAVLNEFHLKEKSCLHFFRFTFIKFSEHHETKLFRSDWRREDRDSVRSQPSNFALSAYIRIWLNLIIVGRSLMYRIRGLSGFLEGHQVSRETHQMWSC